MAYPAEAVKEVQWARPSYDAFDNPTARSRARAQGRPAPSSTSCAGGCTVTQNGARMFRTAGAGCLKRQNWAARPSF